MRRKKSQTDQPGTQALLDLRFTAANFRLLQESTYPTNLTPVMQVYHDQLMDIGFSFSHEFQIEQSIGKSPDNPARMLVFLNAAQSAYALLTDLYHVKSWVYFTHYFTLDRRIITTCQPGALELGATSVTASFELQNLKTRNFTSQSIKSQWKNHQSLISAGHPAERALLMDPAQHLDAEREAYRKYTDLLLDAVILRQSDTQLVGFTHTGASSFHAAVNSTSAKRPNPKVNELTASRSESSFFNHRNFRNAALAASTAVFAVLAYNVVTLSGNNSVDTSSSTTAALPTETPKTEQPSTTLAAVTTADIQSIDQSIDNSLLPPSTEDVLPIAPDEPANTAPEQFVVASEEDEMWRIAVENAEFYLMSNDGDPAPWIRTARKMAAGFTSDDPRLARTYFLAAMLEPDPEVAEQRYNRALSIQTKTLGLYHTETAQTLEALAWVAEGARDDLEAAITHQRLALNVYRSIFGEEAEDTRAARWKLQYFEDRLDGRRPKSDDNRRLLPALARFAR